MQHLHTYFVDRFDAVESGADALVLGRTGIHSQGPGMPPAAPPVPAPEPTPAPVPAPAPSDRRKEMDAKNKPQIGDGPAQATEGAENICETHREGTNKPPAPLEDAKDAHARESRENNPHPEKTYEPTPGSPGATDRALRELFPDAKDIDPELLKRVQEAEQAKREMFDMWGVK